MPIGIMAAWEARTPHGLALASPAGADRMRRPDPVLDPERPMTTPHLALIALVAAALLLSLAEGQRRRPRKWHRLTPQGRDKTFLDLSDPGDQLKAVEAATVTPRKPVNYSASGVLKLLEALVADRRAHHYRVFAEVSMGAFLTTAAPKGHEHIGNLAFRSINSKRVDFLIIDTAGHPALAVEYHGAGHHQAGGRAAARDAVKRRALEKAGIELVEIQNSYDAMQSRVMVEHALERYEKRAPRSASVPESAAPSSKALGSA
jgi:very-short-patch-repair endonuclease